MSVPRLKVINVGSGDGSSLEHRIAKALDMAHTEAGSPLKAQDVLGALMTVAGQIISQTPPDIRPRFLEHAEIVLRERSAPQ